MAESIERINELLKEHYGMDVVTSQPKFRIVFTSKQFEKRYEEFAEFFGDIFLRTTKGVMEVPKYPEEYQDMWVLERLLPTVGNPYLEMVVPFSYEPVWIFGAAKSDKTPIWRAVRLLVENALHGDPNRVNKSPSDLMEEEEERMRKEKVLFKQMLQDDSPIIPTLVHSGSGVYLDHSNFEKKGN